MPQYQQPPLDIAPATHHDIANHDHCPFVRDWQAHVSAGRIGGNPPAPPAVAAQLAENDALFRGFASDRRRLGRSVGRV